MFVPSWRAPADVDEHDGQTRSRKGVGQRAPLAPGCLPRLKGRHAREAPSQVENYTGCLDEQVVPRLFLFKNRRPARRDPGNSVIRRQP